MNALWTDAYPNMRDGDLLLLTHREHVCTVARTDEVGCDTGRRRYRVLCRTCHVIVHPATTGPQQQIEMHVSQVEEAGTPLPFPGTQIGDDK